MNIYHELLGEIPKYLLQYLDVDSLNRLKKICYFCGMDYASKDIYDFKYRISRYDHSISTSLITAMFSNDKKEVIAALFHDIATPVFSHVIDYMNHDYNKQESTEEKTGEIIYSDKQLISLLKKDGISVDDIINFKKYSLVDLNRPSLCADRLDGIILSSLSWTKKIDLIDVKSILANLKIFVNENNDLEIGCNYETAKYLVELEQEINNYCHSDYDNYMMNLLSILTKYIIDFNVIKYDDLYKLNEEEMFDIFEEFAKKDLYFDKLYYIFKNIKKEDIKLTKFPDVKKRVINPLIGNGTRLY